MATNSPRLGLILPEEGDYLDDGVMSGNFAKLDARAGAVICTSTTRPSTPYDGMLIYETDTDYFRVRKSPAWPRVGQGARRYGTITDIDVPSAGRMTFANAGILVKDGIVTAIGYMNVGAAFNLPVGASYNCAKITPAPMNAPVRFLAGCSNPTVGYVGIHVAQGTGVLSLNSRHNAAMSFTVGSFIDLGNLTYITEEDQSG